MTFTSGLYVLCAAPECDSTDLTVVRESFDEQDSIFVGEQRCNACGAAMLYSRRPTPQERHMATRLKKTKAGRKTWTAERQTDTEQARVNTIPANGDQPESREVLPEKVTIGEAMRRAVENLGEVVIDEDQAPAHLRALAECYEQVTREQAAYDAKSEEAKTAKKSLESAQALLLEKVRMFTHPTPMPLFDQQQAEEDHSEMLAASEAQVEH